MGLFQLTVATTACLLTLLAITACLPSAQAQDDPADAQGNPTAITIASTLLDPIAFELIKAGPNQPMFRGPAGSAEIITYWAPGATVEQAAMPAGAVKLTIARARATVILKFSAVVKVCLYYAQATCTCMCMCTCMRKEGHMQLCLSRLLGLFS
jgi:hypothetical protein